MPDQDKKLKSTEKATDKKPPGISMRDYSDLKRLQSLLSVQSRNQQLPAIYFGSGQTSVTRAWQNVKSNEQKSNGQWQESAEAVELKTFSVTYKNKRNFCKHPKHRLFQDIFMTSVKNRLTCMQWVIQAPSIHPFSWSINRCVIIDKGSILPDIFQKLPAVKNKREWVIASGAHKALINLLSVRDNSVFLGALLALTSSAERERSLVSDHSSAGSLSSANAAWRIQYLHLSGDLSPDEMQENTFSLQADDRLYIAMELIEGCHWKNTFTLCKKSNNCLQKTEYVIYLSKIIVADFRLAKQKQENCKLASVVGAILYSCPDVVKSEPYGEKADVWAVGCILYQMATLNPPFYSTNMLSLAAKIVGAVYEPGQKDSEKVSFTIKNCLTSDGEVCPHIMGVTSLLFDVMMKYLDVLSTPRLMLGKKLDQERGQTQQYFTEANRNEKNDEKLSLHSSSSGAASCKSEFSEYTDLLVDSCQSAHGKDEERTYEAILVEDHTNMEKGIFSEFDDELDILDNSISSSLS